MKIGITCACRLEIVYFGEEERDGMNLSIRTSVELVMVSLAKDGTLYITGSKSKLKRKIKDKVRQLSELNYLESVGIIVRGDIDSIKRIIKAECPSLSSIEIESTIYKDEIY